MEMAKEKLSSLVKSIDSERFLVRFERKIRKYDCSKEKLQNVILRNKTRKT